MNKNNLNNHSTTRRRERSLPSVKDMGDIVLPPPVNGENQRLYDRIIKPNGMNGTERFFSVPENRAGISSMKQYLKGFCGTNVCISFWAHPKGRFEKCGILYEVGDDFLSLKDKKSGRIIITKIENIKYISVFCI